MSASGAWIWSGLVARRGGRYATVLLIAGACSGSDRSQSRELEDGDINAGSIAVDWRAEHVDRLEPTGARLSVGIDGRPLSGGITDFDVGGDGRIAVLDGGAGRVTVFDSLGSPLLAFGRLGGGPGAFGDAVALAYAADGTVWVVDYALARYSQFDADGRLRTTVARPSAAQPRPWPGRITRAGVILDESSPPVPLPELASVVRLRIPSGQIDSLPLPSYAPQALVVRHASGAPLASVPMPFAPTRQWVADDEGTVWFGIGSQIRLVRMTPAGDTTTAVAARAADVPVSEGDRRDVLAALEPLKSLGGTVSGDAFPSTLPAFSQLAVDDQGNVWIRHRIDGAQPPRFAVFAADGQFIGQVVPPVGLSYHSPVIRQGVLYAVTFDENGDEAIQRFQVPPRYR